MIYSSLIDKIEDTLEKIGSIKQIIVGPSELIEKYPCVVFYPDSFDNDFASTADNFKIYRFKMFIVVGSAQKSKEDLFGTILPKAVDDVIAQFDEDWDAGNIEGHRAWALLNSGVWGFSKTDKGIEAWAEINVIIKLQTTN